MTDTLATTRTGFILICGLVLSSLSGCGFQLRTWNIDSAIEAIVINSVEPGGELTQDLRRAFRQAGVAVTDAAANVEPIVDTEAQASATAESPSLTLNLLNVDRQRRSISVTGQARAAEYELLLNVQYGLTEQGVTEHIAPRWVRVQRVYRVDRNNLMGSNEEEALLRREMHNDVVQQILRAVNQVMTTET